MMYAQVSESREQRGPNHLVPSVNSNPQPPTGLGRRRVTPLTTSANTLRRALPKPLRRWWRGQPRLALEDSAAVQIVEQLPITPDDRLLALGRDAPLLAALLADAAQLEQRPLALIGRTAPAPSPAELELDILRGRADRLPLADASVSVAVLPHQLRRWDDDRALRVLRELWRVLEHNGVAVLWEIAPSRSPRLNQLWRAALTDPHGPPQLRSFAQLGRLAYDAHFAWVQTLPLRPFLWPPGPRVSVLIRKEHYRRDAAE